MPYTCSLPHHLHSLGLQHVCHRGCKARTIGRLVFWSCYQSVSLVHPDIQHHSVSSSLLAAHGTRALECRRIYMHECIRLTSAVWEGPLADVACLALGLCWLMWTPSAPPPRAQPHPQPTEASPRATRFMIVLHQYVREMKRLDDMAREKPCLRSGRYSESPRTLSPQQAAGCCRAPHQEAQTDLSEADLPHSSTQLLQVSSSASKVHYRSVLYRPPTLL